MPNARVLPEPVEAFPITSRPARISGIAANCMGVGVVNLRFDREAGVCAERLRFDQALKSTSSFSPKSSSTKPAKDVCHFPSIPFPFNERADHSKS